MKLDVDPTIQNPLPPITVDGPFGPTPGTLWKKDVAVLVAVGSSVIVFASILKSIWYRMNYAYEGTALRKIYFFWLCDDMIGFEWFKSLILAIEAQNLDDNIEVHPVGIASTIKTRNLILLSTSQITIKVTLAPRQRLLVRTKTSLLACVYPHHLAHQTGTLFSKPLRSSTVHPIWAFSHATHPT